MRAGILCRFQAPSILYDRSKPTSDCSSAFSNGATYNINSKGDSGHPCLRPLGTGRGLVMWSSHSIRTETPSYSACSRFTSASFIPSPRSRLQSMFRSTVSYALEMSRNAA
ncbi:unnamed protein product [Ixodes persulcatus]